MHKLIAHPVRRLSLSLGFGFLVTVASAATAGGALMSSLNIVFGTPETRGFLRRQATALALTAGLVSFVVTLLGLLAVTPPVLRHLGFRPHAASALALARWPVAALMVGGALAAIYRHGPDHRADRGQRAGWMLGWGTPVATAAWLAATAGFSLYAAKFHTFDRTYGSIGAAVALLVWLYLTALVVLLGGALHAAARRRVTRLSPAPRAPPASE
jgi:membrane protein